MSKHGRLMMVVGLFWVTTGLVAANPSQAPAANKPVVRSPAPALTGAQYVREPVIKAPVDNNAAGSLATDNNAADGNPAIQQTRQQLQELQQQLDSLQRQRQASTTWSAHDRQQWQSLLDRKAKAEQQLAQLLQQQRDSTDMLRQNIK
jgi:hypothetical protein